MHCSTKDQLEQINQQIKELVRIYRLAMGQTGISDNEFWVWYTLINMEGEFTQQDLCGLWSLSKQTVNTIIAHMVRRGHAVLEVIPGTRNRKKILLTEEGRRYGAGIVLPVSAGELRAFQRLSPEERRTWSAILDKYICLLKEEFYAEQET